MFGVKLILTFVNCKHKRLLGSWEFNLECKQSYYYLSSNKSQKNNLCLSLTNVASVGSVFNGTRKVMVLSLPETIKEKIDVSNEGPSSGVSD